MTTWNTGMTAHEGHLRSADCFDAERFPYLILGRRDDGSGLRDAPA